MSDNSDMLEVCIVHPEMREAFKEWVKTQGWHLAGPIKISPSDMPVHFLQPMSSPEALDAYIKAGRP